MTTTPGSYRRRRYLNHGPLSVDATGTRRRVQALVAIGWPMSQQSARLGMERSSVHAMTRHTWVHLDTAAKVTALYDELSMVPGPNNRARLQAKKRGWAPPLAWAEDEIDDPTARPNIGTHQPRSFDEVAVQRAMHADRVPLRPVERTAAVRRLTAAGLSAAQIAARLGIDPRSVQRHRGTKEAS